MIILDTQAHPHILDAVVNAADVPALLRLRAVCSYLRDRVDKKLAYHLIYIDSNFFLGGSHGWFTPLNVTAIPLTDEQGTRYRHPILGLGPIPLTTYSEFRDKGDPSGRQQRYSAFCEERKDPMTDYGQVEAYFNRFQAVVEHTEILDIRESFVVTPAKGDKRGGGLNINSSLPLLRIWTYDGMLLPSIAHPGSIFGNPRSIVFLNHSDLHRSVTVSSAGTEIHLPSSSSSPVHTFVFSGTLSTCPFGRGGETLAVSGQRILHLRSGVEYFFAIGIDDDVVLVYKPGDLAPLQSFLGRAGPPLRPNWLSRNYTLVKLADDDDAPVVQGTPPTPTAEEVVEGFAGPHLERFRFISLKEWADEMPPERFAQVMGCQVSYAAEDGDDTPSPEPSPQP